MTDKYLHLYHFNKLVEQLVYLTRHLWGKGYWNSLYNNETISGV